jgi:hypothetical protein
MEVNLDVYEHDWDLIILHVLLPLWSGVARWYTVPIRQIFSLRIPHGDGPCCIVQETTEPWRYECIYKYSTKVHMLCKKCYVYETINAGWYQWLPDTSPQVRPQVRTRTIRSGQRGTGASLLSSTLLSFANLHFTNCSISVNVSIINVTHSQYCAVEEKWLEIDLRWSGYLDLINRRVKNSNCLSNISCLITYLTSSITKLHTYRMAINSYQYCNVKTRYLRYDWRNILAPSYTCGLNWDKWINKIN